MTIYAPHLPSLSAAYATGLTQPMKSEYYPEDELANPFASGYQMITGMEIPPSQAYVESDALLCPPLKMS